MWTDKFDENKLTDFQPRDYNQTILGAFVQNNWEATEWLNLETGLRTDYVPDYGTAILPRVSAHFKITDNFPPGSEEGLAIKHLLSLQKIAKGFNTSMYYQSTRIRINWKEVTG